MGKKRIADLGKEEEQKVHIKGMKGGERVKIVGVEPIAGVAEEPTTETDKLKETKKLTRNSKTRGLPRAKTRGKTYRAAKSKIDPAKLYSVTEAVTLIKETTRKSFDSSAEAHLVTIKTGLRGEVALPHLEGKTRRVAIANPETLAKIESGKFDFDILLSTPAFMPNMVKFAKVLGPKGLMPNPKNGTVVENPEKEAEKFQKATISYKTETSAPLVHFVFGKTSQKSEELEANLKILIQTIGPKNIKRLVIASSMGPGIKVAIDNC
ncbi:MAG: hypothetical protein Q8Q15_03925 [bacterium]|nr:hypothetical protein [bacterium]